MASFFCLFESKFSLIYFQRKAMQHNFLMAWHFTQEYTLVNWFDWFASYLCYKAVQQTDLHICIGLFYTALQNTLPYFTTHYAAKPHYTTLQFTAWYNRWQNTISKRADWHMLAVGKISRNLSAYQCTGVSYFCSQHLSL